MNIGFPSQTVSVLRRFAVLAVLAVTLANGPAVASDREGDAERLQQRVEAFKDRLKLTPEQTERLEPIFLESLAARRDILAKYGVSGDERPELSMRQKISLARELRAARNASDAEIGEHLTAEQRAELKKIQDEWRDRFRNRDR